jgi:putative ABC transport system permease protein
LPFRSASTCRIVAALAALSLGSPASGAAQAGRDPAEPPYQLAIERRLARQLGLHVGDTLRIGPSVDSVVRPAVVAAIYEPRPDPSGIIRPDFYARLHLPDLAALLGAPDRVDRFGVGLQPGSDPEEVAAILNRAAFGFRAFPSNDIASSSSQTFLVVSRFHRAIALITVVASAIFLLCIMLLKVEERRIDVAVMRFVGVRRRAVFLALIVEASLIALAGSALGVAIALAGGAATNAYYRRLFDTPLVFSQVTPRILVFGVALSVMLGLGAGALAAWRLLRTPPLALWGRAG